MLPGLTAASPGRRYYFPDKPDCAELLRFIILQIKAVIPPEMRMISKSIGAITIAPIPSKRNPEPKRYRCPLSKIISPAYIASVVTADMSAGSKIDSLLLLPRVNEPAKTPTVTPNKMKNTAINTADRADTVISPVR